MQITVPDGFRNRLATTLAILGAATLLAFSMWAAWANTADDAYITLRYARHLADGLGVIWNPGEPAVEGYSNFLFVLLGAALIKVGAGVGGDPIVWLKVLGVGAAAGTLGLAFLFATERFGHAIGAAVAVALAVHPGQAFWAVSGMESAVNQFLIFVAVYLVGTPLGAPVADDARVPTGIRSQIEAKANKRRLVVAALALLLASITRPETPIVLVALTAFVASGRGLGSLAARIRSTAYLVLPFLSLYLPYTAWRLWTYGRWLPNSAACKAGYAADPFYLGREFLTFAGPLLLLAILGLILGNQRLRRELSLLLVIPALYFAVFYGVDPVMSHLDRHFLAVLPFVALAGVFGLACLLKAVLPRNMKRLSGLIVLGIAIVYGAAAAPTTLARVRQAVDLAHPLEDLRRELGGYLASQLELGDSYAIGDTGLVPFLAAGKVLDVYCLNCREATEPPIDRSPERLAAWILSQRPRFIVVQVVAAASERGVWPADQALQEQSSLQSGYSRQRDFGGPDDPLRYVVYERRSRASL